MKSMPEVRFEFDPEKVVQALVFFSKRGVGELTRLKAAKLLYFADKYHLLRYGRPITGDHYYCMNLGPLPSEANDLLNEAEAAVSASLPIGEPVAPALRVEKAIWQRYPRFVAHSDPDLDVFSESEVEALTHTISEYGRLSARKLVDLTHEEAGWLEANSKRRPGGRAELPYELFFAGQPEAETLLELVRAEQADRDLAEQLS